MMNDLVPVCAALTEHHRAAHSTEQLGGKQVIVLCLSPGRGFLVFGDNIYHDPHKIAIIFRDITKTDYYAKRTNCTSPIAIGGISAPMINC